MTIEVKGLGRITADKRNIKKLAEALDKAGYQFDYDIPYVDEQKKYKAMSEWCDTAFRSIYEAILKGAKK